MAVTTDTGTGFEGGLTAEQLADYERDGFVVVRNAIDGPSLDRFGAAALRQSPDDTPDDLVWPEPGRYTLASNAMRDPDLAFLMARSEIVETMRSVLDGDPKILMFAYYDRTPGGPGLPPHNDYKRWRPIGSSMNWAFAIVPLVDYTSETGRLLLAPGSHRVEHTPDDRAPVWNAGRPSAPTMDDFVDPELRRGDLALVNMHCWHRAEPNTSDTHRTGLFTKWAAATHPPATGWWLFNDEVAKALGPDGEHVMAVWNENEIETTRALIERERDGETQFLFLKTDAGLQLPGGPAEYEGSIPDWDRGNYIASLTDALAEQIKTRPPWMSYVGDYDEAGSDKTAHVCRVYGYKVPSDAWGIGGPEISWRSADQLDDVATAFAADAIAEWKRPGIVRGKGVTEAHGRADQYSA